MTKNIKVKTYLLYSLAVAIASVAVYMIAKQTVETRVKVSSNAASVEDVKGSVTSLMNDNAQQTIILCTIILSQTKTEDGLSSEDIAKIENICKQKIKQTSEGTVPSDQASVASPAQDNQVQSGSSSFPNNIPEIPNQQSNKSQGNGNNSNTPPNPSDNDGVIINLPDTVPMLPNQVHIHSPL